ncbi:MAG: threonine synthase, partial [Anaerolineales bacterium]
MTSHFHVKCFDCGLEAPYAPLSTTCPRCDGEWREARYDYESLKNNFLQKLWNRPFLLWRYRELLPVHNPNPDITLGEGGTPLIRAVNLGMMLG